MTCWLKRAAKQICRCFGGLVSHSANRLYWLAGTGQYAYEAENIVCMSPVITSNTDIPIWTTTLCFLQPMAIVLFAVVSLAAVAADYIKMVCDVTLPAIPDFKWGHATNGDVDNDGWCIVTVQAFGHHTGGPLEMPGLEPLPPTGKYFCLAEEIQRVKVQGGKVVEVEVLPTKGAGPRAFYQALGGKLPATASVAAPPMP
eukprot:GHUV01014950.1.p1 GENE.GHUV01014950.1~~GHUV01014950.1.p1  ORF type:complete len:200 (+),score=42.51 GHUV01014950.1:361-960(+)